MTSDSTLDNKDRAPGETPDRGQAFAPGSTWVIKIGSSLLTNQGQGLIPARIDSWVEDILTLRSQGIACVLVSSGAIAEGMTRLGLKERPGSIHRLQAAAAVGQMGLIQAYEASFQRFGLHTAQVLLTHDDLRSRQRYLNARSTLGELLALGVTPVVNENDTVVTDEIRFGDNDTLAALVANLIEASTLVLMTDRKGLYSSDPDSPDARLIELADAGDPALDAMASAGGDSPMGRGGMVTKISAARIAARSGANTIICAGHQVGVLSRLATGKVAGTLLKASRSPVAARKQWLATLAVKGKLMLDAGACQVITGRGRSLLPVGVLGTEGHYTRGDVVACSDENNRVIARGLVNYSHTEVSQICGIASNDIESKLGYVAEEELIHRDNLVIL